MSVKTGPEVNRYNKFMERYMFLSDTLSELSDATLAMKVELEMMRQELYANAYEDTGTEETEH